MGREAEDSGPGSELVGEHAGEGQLCVWTGGVPVLAHVDQAAPAQACDTVNGQTVTLAARAPA